MTFFPDSVPAPVSAANPADAPSVTRREAIRRAALFLGAAISPSILHGVLNAQPALPPVGTPAGASAQPVNLDAHQFEIVSAAAERIVPRTDTPGALDVGVPAFIDLMAGGYMTGEEKKMFLAGLTDLEAASRTAHDRGFAQLSPEQQDALLRRVAEASQNKEKSFFHQLKELTVVGYFTAEPVGKTVLHYDPIPGRFEGCIPRAEVGAAAWMPNHR